MNKREVLKRIMRSYDYESEEAESIRDALISLHDLSIIAQHARSKEIIPQSKIFKGATTTFGNVVVSAKCWESK